MSELGWNDEVDSEATGARALLPEGPCHFVVIGFKRERDAFGKLGTINIAAMKLLVSPLEAEGDEMQEIGVKIGLHSDLQWKITEFFTSIGQRKHGEKGKFVPRWDKVDGSEGWCIVKYRDYTNKRGEKVKVNDIAKFVTKGEAEAHLSKTTKPEAKDAAPADDDGPRF